MTQRFLSSVLDRNHVWSRMGRGGKILIECMCQCETEETILRRIIRPSCEELQHWQLDRVWWCWKRGNEERRRNQKIHQGNQRKQKNDFKGSICYHVLLYLTLKISIRFSDRRSLLTLARALWSEVSGSQIATMNLGKGVWKSTEYFYGEVVVLVKKDFRSRDMFSLFL